MGETVVVCEEPRRRVIMTVNEEPSKVLATLTEKDIGDCERLTLYRAVFYASLSRQALMDLSERLAAERGAEERRRGVEQRPPASVAVVFDQMFKGFADVVARETSREIEFHEIVGRGLDKPLKTGRVYRQPARDDYDILKLLEELAKKKGKVLFFTGDKRLATQAEAIPNVHVEYMPPGEFTGKEAAIKRMVERIQEALGDTG